MGSVVQIHRGRAAVMGRPGLNLPGRPRPLATAGPTAPREGGRGRP